VIARRNLEEKIYYKIIEFIRARRGSVFDESALAKYISDNLNEDKEILNKLVSNGILRKIKGRQFSLVSDVDIELGKLSLHRNGFGFVSSMSGNDIFIPPRFVKNARDGDVVLAGVLRRHRRSEGWIIDVLKRASEFVVAKYVQDGKFSRGIPLDEKADYEIVLDKNGKTHVTSGQIILVRLRSFPQKNKDAYGVIEKIIGEQGIYETDIKTVLYKYGIPVEFSPSTVEELKRIPDEVTEEELHGRRDLRALPFVTIDGEDAKDFDDAVYVEEDNGLFRLFVSIADVSNYVKPGTSLDREALDRGTSVYFPDRAIPMLPEKLSSNLASLKPGVDRLTMTAEMTIDRHGNIKNSFLYPSVIRSKKRMTYTILRKILEGDDIPDSEYATLKPIFQKMLVLRNLLLEKRMRRGSLIFDLPEPKVILNEAKEPVEIKKFLSDFSHSIVEEFMLSANETVARTLERAGIPLIFRIHEPPDAIDIKSLSVFLRARGYKLVMNNGKIEPGNLQGVLDQCRGKSDEFLVNMIVLRSLKQARYSITNAGHFGLASESYCHFTSPIRRYPDLVVHRILKSYLSGKLTKSAMAEFRDELKYIAYRSSERERVAIDAEREMVDRIRARFMIDKIGDDFDARVVMIKESGLFIELDGHFIEGFIGVDEMEHDYYRYDENSMMLIGLRKKRKIRIGDRVKVKVTGVNQDFGKVNFKLIGY
jgi:ribonuclease R